MQKAQKIYCKAKKSSRCEESASGGRRGNLLRLLHFVRNDNPLDNNLSDSFTIVIRVYLRKSVS